MAVSSRSSGKCPSRTVGVPGSRAPRRRSVASTRAQQASRVPNGSGWSTYSSAHTTPAPSARASVHRSWFPGVHTSHANRSRTERSAQALTRPGFDLRRHYLSQLGTGGLGWIQIGNFVVAGLLYLAFAVGIRSALHPGRAGTWGPLLIGSYGICLLVAGVFVADPTTASRKGRRTACPAR